MNLWDELRRTISTLDSAGQADGLSTKCLRGIEILESLGGKEAALTGLVQCRPQPEDGAEAARRWLQELNYAIEAAFVGGRVLVLKTMHLTHGLRESLPFDDTTALLDVERHLLQRYKTSIPQYIATFTSDPLPDEMIRLDFYEGSPREGVEPIPVNLR